MGLLSKLFGTGDVIEKAAEGIYNGIDKIVYTDEEKAQMRFKAAEQFLRLLKAYEPFKIAQRFIALIIITPYVAIWIVSAGLLILGGIYGLDNVVQVSKELVEKNNEILGLPVSIILGFYFSGGLLEGTIEKWKGK